MFQPPSPSESAVVVTRGIVVAGTASGVGKTTVTLTLIGALTRRGYRVQPFKAGPDYIDTSYHTAASGRASRNLDTWMLDAVAVRELFSRAMQAADFAVVEGVMGLYDGRDGTGEAGSTAELAKLLRLPVLLVVDAFAAARSVGATALGFKSFDPDVALAGVLLNRIAGERHYDLARPSIEKAGLRPLGYVPRLPDLALPERHLGLVPAGERALPAGYLERLVRLTEKTLELEAVIEAASTIGPGTLASSETDPADLADAGNSSAGKGSLARPHGRQGDPENERLFPSMPVPKRATIAVARDQAFSFYYADSLDLLNAWGAELAPFSPIESSSLPAGVDGVYIGGGFPEVYAHALAANLGMKQSLRDAAAGGVPIYGECGGLMYLGESLVDEEGRRHEMAGLIPSRSTMTGARLTLGYRTARVLKDTPLARAGEVVRGHEFHYSVLESAPVPHIAVYEQTEPSHRLEGFKVGSVIASYLHLHFGMRHGMPRRFVEVCVQNRRRRG